MRTSLVTGAGGFLGRHVLEFLVARGDRTIGIGHGAGQGQQPESAALISGTVDFANLQQVTSDFGSIDAVFHLAGGAHVGQSFANPVEDFDRTVGSTSQLLDWVRLSNPHAKVIVASSAAVYGSGHEGPIPESSPLAPFSPYGFHKSIQEQLCRSYGKNFGVSISIVRLFSVYGERLQKQLVFDLCGKLAGQPESIELFGTGTEVRDWLHVDDVVRLLVLALECSSPECLIVNGGTGNGVTVAKVAETLCSVLGLNTSVAFNGKGRPGDPISLIADATQSKEMGFRPQVDLETGLRRVAHWYRQWSS